MTFGTLGRTALLATLLVSPPVVAEAADEATSAVPSYQGTVGATVFGPGRIATTDSGQFLVIDGNRKLQLLTKRGDLAATLRTGVAAVAAGGGRIFVATVGNELVTLDATFGRQVARAPIGMGLAPTAMAYDAVRDAVWTVYPSGTIQALRQDGSVAVHLSSEATGPLFDLVDVAVDGATDTLWVAQGREADVGMLFGLDAATGTRKVVVGAGSTGPVKTLGALLVRSTDEVFVSDLFDNSVEVVDSVGAPVMTIPLEPLSPTEPSQPKGLAFMANGDMLVANQFAGRLERYGDGSPLPTCTDDADCDGMPDAWEVAHGLNPADPRDVLRDLDGDGLANLQEFAIATDPGAVDTDGDGFLDGDEVAGGFDPTVGGDHRPLVVATGASDFAPGRVTLSASVTRIQDPAACSAAWQQTAGPAVALSGAQTFGPSFLARKAGGYAFSVAATCDGVAADPAQDVVNVLEVPPIADVARVSVVDLHRPVTLSALRSSDANGDALAFAWDQVAGRAVSRGAAAGSMSTRFDVAGTYRFSVTVSDDSGATSEAEADVVALGGKPIPAAAVVTPVVAQVGQPVALDASGSYVTGAAAFAWRQVSGAAVVLADAAGAVAAFVPPAAGRYVFEVVVSQAQFASPPARVEVFVAEAGGALPVAGAVAAPVAAVGEAVVLDGTSSAAAGGGSLAFAWRQVSGPAAGVSAADQAVASAHLFSAGSYEFELTVKEGATVSQPARIRVEARSAGRAIPVARVSAPTAGLVGQSIVLDGSGSTGGTSFRWLQVGGPWVVLDAKSVVSFRPRAAGTYVFELEVDDGQVRSAPARVSVVVSDDGMEN